MSPSIHDKIVLVLHRRAVSLMSKRRRRVATKLRGISFRNVLCLTGSEAIIAAVPPISKILEIFDHTTLEISKAVSPLDEAMRLTNSSGADVPNARIVSPITMGGIPNLLATLLLHHTSISPHHTREMSHRRINNDAKAIPIHPSNKGLVILIIPPVMIVNKRMINGMKKARNN